jgi:photosystem II stability/assembly factor-like uncharacterized protein
MAAVTHIYAGAAHWRAKGKYAGVFRAEANEGRWEHLTQGLPADVHVQAVTVHPREPEMVFIGTHDGPYRSTDRGAHWEKLDFPDRDMQVWSILVHPAKPQTIYVGTAPLGVYRSDDGGDHWRVLSRPAMPAHCDMGFAPRVMRLAIDPENPDILYAPLEVNGVMRSRDGGESWEDCSAGLMRLSERPHLKSGLVSKLDAEGMLDCHALCVTPADPGAVFIALRMGLFRSDDRGETWEDMEIRRFSPLTYGRDVRVSPQDPRVLYACLSVESFGKNGALYRSGDIGKTWQRFDHSVTSRGTMMNLAVHPRDPDQIYAVARGGQAFGTQDGGKSWREYPLPADASPDFYAIACG